MPTETNEDVTNSTLPPYTAQQICSDNTIFQEVRQILSREVEEDHDLEDFGELSYNDIWILYEQLRQNQSPLIYEALCTEECGHCGENYPRSQLMSISHGNHRYCDNCQNDYSAECDDCGEYFDIDELETDQNDERFCEVCRNRDITSRVLTQISTRRNTVKLLTPQDEFGDIIKSTRAWSTEIEFCSTDNGKLKKATNKMPKEFGIAHDGSVRSGGMDHKGKTIISGLEIQTAVLAGKKGEEILANTIDDFAEAGGYVDKTCGLHVHVDFADYWDNLEVLKRLFAFHWVFEEVIKSFLPHERRLNGYCLGIKEFSLETLQKVSSLAELAHYWYKETSKSSLKGRLSSIKDGTRYHGLNFHILLAQGHAEIRYHSGTLNSKKALEWLNLHTRILDYISGNLDKKVVRNERTFNPLIQNIDSMPNRKEIRIETDKKGTIIEIDENVLEPIDDIPVSDELKALLAQHEWVLLVGGVKMIDKEFFFLEKEEKKIVNAYVDKLKKWKQEQLAKLREIEERRLAKEQEKINKKLEGVHTIEEMILLDKYNLKTKTENLFNILKLSDESRAYLLHRQEKFAKSKDEENTYIIKPITKEEPSY